MTCLILTSLACVGNLQAQVNKGAMMVGGSVNFESEDGESVFQFEPQLGYFITDKLGAGVNFNIDVEEETQIEFGPFIRYYVWKNLFPQVGLLYNKTGEDEAYTEYNFGLGYSIFATPNVAFEPVFIYNSGDGYSRTYIGIGVQAFLGRK
ncbi:MAG: hypothetical protein RI973_862 [Bacteroidota bacterium]